MNIPSSLKTWWALTPNATTGFSWRETTLIYYQPYRRRGSGNQKTTSDAQLDESSITRYVSTTSAFAVSLISPAVAS